MRTVQEHSKNEFAKAGCLLLVFVCLLSVRSEAGTSASVRGVVRDGRGVGQMGVLVQVLRRSSATAATAITDLHGSYFVASLDPGRYRVRASAPLYVPAVRGNLELKSGGQKIVNLTLATIYEDVSLLPAAVRSADEPADDWKWTLRSPVKRPILRVLDQGNQEPTWAGDGVGSGTRNRAHGFAAVRHGAGVYGHGSERFLLTSSMPISRSGDVLMHAEVSAGPGSGSAWAFGLQEQSEHGATRTLVRGERYPELNGLVVTEVQNAHELSFGDTLRIEVGGRVRLVRETASATQMQPFVRVTGRLSSSWTVQYRMATCADLQGFEDLDQMMEDAPVAVRSGDRLSLESGRHQELSFHRAGGHGSLEIAVYHDALNRVAVAGVGSPEGVKGVTAGGFGQEFRTLAAGYKTSGVNLVLNTPITRRVKGTVEYTTGRALGGAEGGAETLQAALTELKPRTAQAATIGVRGHVGSASLRAAYRWQTPKTVTTLDPYEDASEKPYVSLGLRQPLRWAGHLPPGLEATVEVTNLLAEGYRQVLSDDEQTLYLTQSPRTIQAGLAVSF